ncbi:MAG: GNAT family N-acetyltransferase [Bacteroidales bacterium]
MIRYLRNSKIDRSLWDLCVESSPHARVYAASWYLDRVHPGWGALVLDDYRAVFPLPVSRKYGISYVHTPFFVQQLGTFCREGDPGTYTGLFLEALPSCIRYLDLCLNHADRIVEDTGWWYNRMNLVLDLSPGVDVLRKSYSENTRRNLAGAEKWGIGVKPSGDAHYLVHLFRKDRGREFGQIRERHYRALLSLMNYSLRIGTGRIMMAESGGERLAGAFFLEYSRRLYFLFSGNSPAGRRQGAIPCLIDRMIEEYAGKSMELDFEGSDSEGLARFYRGFGAGQEKYPRVVINRLPWPLNRFK